MSQKKIYSGLIKLAIGTLGSRALGFVREILSARFVGGGHEMDIFAAAYRIPNLLRGILGEKAAESAFLPVYKRLISQNKTKEASQVSADSFKIFLLLLFFFFAILFTFAPIVVSAFSHGFAGITLKDGSDKFVSAISMTRLLLPTIIMVGFFSFIGAHMLAKERFGAYSAAPIISNAVAIITIILTHPFAKWYCLAYGFFAGALAECVFFWLLTKDKKDFIGDKLFKINISDPNLKQAGKLWSPIVLGSVLEKIGSLIEIRMASFLGQGAVSALYYGNLVNLLSFSILGLSFNRSVLPYLTEQNAKNNNAELKRIILTGIRMNIILLLPVSIFVSLLSHPIVKLLFEHGAFDSLASQRTSLALVCYSIGLVAIGLTTLFSRAFYALLDAKTPIIISSITLTINVILNLMLWKTPLRHGGLALSTSISLWINAVLLIVLLNKKLKLKNANVSLKEVTDILWRTALPSFFIVFTVYFSEPYINSFIVGNGLFFESLRLIIFGFIALITFVVLGLVCKIEELKKIMLKLRANN